MACIVSIQKMTSIQLQSMKGSNDTCGTRSEANFNTVEFLLDKELSYNKRKISEYHFEETQRENFVLNHRASSYEVSRLYINPLYPSTPVRLYYSRFTPSRKDGTVCIIHGYGQSSDNFIEMAEYFAKNGFVVNMIDMRGFGYSGGVRVFESFKGMLSDIENLLRRCCEKDLPTYLIGHGFGSLLILALLQENPTLPLSGVVCLSPLFRFQCFKETSIFGRLLLFCLGTVWPYLQVNNRINPTALTNNPNKIPQCFQGVFHYQFATLKMSQAHAQLSQKVLKDAEKFKYPLLLLYGSNDTVQPIEEIKKFYKYVGSKQKSSWVFKNGYHHLYSDQNAEKDVFPKIIEWIFDMKSNKNQVKWGVTKPFKLTVLKTIPNKVKYLILVMIPLIIGILLKLRSYLKGRIS